MPSTSSPPRTQEQRTAATRSALLEATIECLIDEGYERATTARIAQRAGVSRGAHLHHFQTRPVLLATALEDLCARQAEEFGRQVASLPRNEMRTRRALDLLWLWYSGPLFQVSVILASAAKTDSDLQRSLQPVQFQLGRKALLRSREMFGQDQQRADLDPLIEMTLCTIRGTALLPLLKPQRKSVEREWRFAREQLERLFDHALGAGPPDPVPSRRGRG